MPKNERPVVKDDPGVDDRFMRGVTKALNTAPKPFTPSAKDKAKNGLGGARRQKSKES
jgi:hypothetical protein